MKYCLLTIICIVSIASIDAYAGDADWPQWRGPQRDGHAAPQSLLQDWPDGGPAVKWSFRNAGRGYSTVSVVDDRVYTMGARGAVCFAICLDLASGEVIWETEVSRAGTGDDYNDGWGAGPRSTPTVDGDQIFVLTDVGTLASLNKSDGVLQWSTDLVDDHGGSIPKWGYSESALVDGDRVIVTPGGESFMIGINRHSGERIWTSKAIDTNSQYVSVMKGTIGASSFYVTAVKEGLMAFDAGSGQPVFSDDTTGNDVAVVPTPILAGDQLYHTSGYGAGCTLLSLREGDDGVTAESTYHLTGKTMNNHHGGVVLVDGVIYGNTRSNGGPWMAQDMESGETLWDEKVGRNRSGSICYADGRLYCYNDKDGSLILAEASREGWKPHGELKLPQETELPRDLGAIWTHPIVASQTLIIRDQDLIFAYDIAR